MPALAYSADAAVVAVVAADAVDGYARAEKVEFAAKLAGCASAVEREGPLVAAEGRRDAVEAAAHLRVVVCPLNARREAWRAFAEKGL